MAENLDNLIFDIPDCRHYEPSVRVGFHYWEIAAGKIIRGVENSANHIFMVMQGELSVTIDDFQNKPIRESQMLFLPMSSDYKCVVVQDVKLLILTCNDNYPECMSDYVADLSSRYPNYKYECCGVQMNDAVNFLARQIIYYLTQGFNCQHIHQYKETELFLLIRHFYPEQEVMKLFNYSVTTDLRFSERVRRNYMKAHTVEELATMLGYSEKVFTRLFTKHFHTTPYQWMQIHRARHIKSRLLDKTVPFKYIMDEFGFSTPAHFNVYCRRYLGDTPTKIRCNSEIDNK